MESLNAGTDTVISTISYTLGNNLEHLILTGTGKINGTGNNLNNRITGNSANNLLTGNGGNDTLLGGAGNDTLIGGTGADSMVGGAGNDILTGGEGNDHFVYNTGKAFATIDIGIDKITDFISGSDQILLDKTTFTAITSAAGSGFSKTTEFATVTSNIVDYLLPIYRLSSCSKFLQLVG